jgi:hypothetical protein
MGDSLADCRCQPFQHLVGVARVAGSVKAV